MEQLTYDKFRDLGHTSNRRISTGYKKVKVRFMYAVKHDGRHKARLVADGHLTDIPVDSVYYRFVSLKRLILVVFLAELNNLELWTTDISNEYLEAKAKEKIFIIVGTEFG